MSRVRETGKGRKSMKFVYNGERGNMAGKKKIEQKQDEKN